jgi:hypothetical protein
LKGYWKHKLMEPWIWWFCKNSFFLWRRPSSFALFICSSSYFLYILLLVHAYWTSSYTLQRLINVSTLLLSLLYHDYRTLIIGGFICLLSLVISSFLEKATMFLFCYSFLFGLGSGLIYPTLIYSTLSH